MKNLATILLTAILVSLCWIVAGFLGLLPGSEPQNVRDDAIEAKASPVETPSTGTTPVTRTAQRPQPDIGRVPVGVTGPGELTIPVAGVKASELVDTFTQARAGGARRHDAIDIMAPTGTPVVAAAPGTVEKIFWSDAGGKTLYVRSVDGSRIHYYAHLDQYAPGIEEGDRVRAGQRLGTVGYSGNANPDAPHLHFEVMATTPDREWFEETSALNPYPLLAGASTGKAEAPEQ